MRISARLDEDALRRRLGEILPITVLLDDDRGMEGRWVTIGRAQNGGSDRRGGGAPGRVGRAALADQEPRR